MVLSPALCVVVLGRNYYVRVPPRGSVFVEAFRLLKMKYKVKGGLAACKPSALKETHPELYEQATWDDVFVDELKRALKACAVFCWYPIYWLCYNQMTNNLISQAGTMWTGKVPNDVLSNIDGLTLLITIPIMDRIVYPALRRMGIPMRPIFRITLGFLLASIAIAYAAGVQSMIYKSPPYYDHVGEADGPNYISAGIQLPAYFFIALSEIFASITGLEYAYKKAPESMKSIVMAAYLFTTCVASILGFALVPVTIDPKLTWMYTGISAVMFVITPIFWFLHRHSDDVDVEEDAIGRDHAEKDAYHQHTRAEVDYEAEVKQVGG
jgi:dipeptide/tripeptide permease